MNILKIDNLVDELMGEGKSIDKIIDELAHRKCYYTLVVMVLTKKELWSEEVKTKINMHNFYSKKSDEENPFVDEFFKMIKKKK